jgi:2-polyprenyl-6-hydroxyphenyl methylase / 3-demethylubiquinone-9 3-methyltransferase
MAALGARVKGIDLSDKALKVALLHLFESRLEVNYEEISAEDLAEREPGQYDVLTCMELLEHVPDPASTVGACAQLVRPGGHVFFSTLNRNPKAYVFAVIGAEYILRLLPRGTHDYAKFLKPSELARYCRAAGLTLTSVIGMGYNPLTKIYSLNDDASVNYLMHCVRDA